VLYHWRIGEGSTALSSDEKPYAVNAAQKAIADHLARRALRGRVVDAPEAPGMNRVVFELPHALPKVTIIIPTRDRVDLLRMCVESVLSRTTYPDFELLIVDNGSVEPATLEFLRNLPTGRCRVVRDEAPFNFAALNNIAARCAAGEFLLLLNNDIEVLTPGWLEEMMRFGLQDGVGVVGARLWYPDGRLQHGGAILGIGGVAGHSHKYLQKGLPGYFGRAVLHQRVSAVTAACLLVRKSTYLAVGGLDEKLQVAFNDIDFCLRVRDEGLHAVWTPYAEMVHHESASRGHETTPEKRARFEGEVNLMKARWRDALLHDPAYSVNLSLEHEDFSLRW
jgi:GT2 family glycosyltransferase